MIFILLVSLSLSLSSGVAASLDDYVSMPDGRMYHSDCVHHHNSHFTSEEIEKYDPCPHPSYSKSLADDVNLTASYYSDWSVYAQTVHKSGFAFMSSTWTVPEKPTNKGPGHQSAVYFFNGLEDGGGVHGAASLILQPVLQFGHSGCLLNPLSWGSWHFGAYLVDGNGRAHCGEMIQVNVGDVVRGDMIKSDDGTNSWKVVASSPGGVSSYETTLDEDTVLDAAYLTLEGMVIYGCDAFPKGGGMDFTAIELGDTKGDIKGTWVPEIRHDDCGQDVQVVDSASVTLVYDSEM